MSTKRKSKVTRLLPKRSMIRTIRGEEWHVVGYWYLPEVREFEMDNKHPMGDCKHCKIWSVNKKEDEPFNGFCENCDIPFIRCTFKKCPDCGMPIIPDPKEVEL